MKNAIDPKIIFDFPVLEKKLMEADWYIWIMLQLLKSLEM
jgi:hypothetical protein